MPEDQVDLATAERKRNRAFVAHQRRRAARERDEAGQTREQASFLRHEGARFRDDGARTRDDAGRVRDSAASVRDDAARERKLSRQLFAEAMRQRLVRSNAVDSPEVLRLDAEAAERAVAATQHDRAASRLDRTASLRDREASERDRDAAASDRAAAEQDREAAELDRNAADADSAAADAGRDEIEDELTLTGYWLSDAERSSHFARVAARTCRDVGAPMASMLTALRTGRESLLRPVDAQLVIEELSARAAQLASTFGELRLVCETESEAQLPVRIDASRLLADAISPHRSAIAAVAKLVVKVHQSPELRVDVATMKKAIGHIIANAILAISGKAETNEIQIVLGGTPELVSITIHDTGVGIAPNVLPHVFEPFFTTHGTDGVGLTMAERVIAHHRGTLRVTSEAGKGTTFTIQLPIAGRDDPAVVTGPEVLLIQANVEDATLLTRVMSRGYVVTRVASAAEGLTVLMPDLNRFTVVFCDGLIAPEMFKKVSEVDEKCAGTLVFLTATPTLDPALGEYKNVELTRPVHAGQLLRLLGDRLAARATA